MPPVEQVHERAHDIGTGGKLVAWLPFGGRPPGRAAPGAHRYPND